jgi:hypothetical protein
MLRREAGVRDGPWQRCCPVPPDGIRRYDVGRMNELPVVTDLAAAPHVQQTLAAGTMMS